MPKIYRQKRSAEFIDAVTRGGVFEKTEKLGWEKLEEGKAQFEVPTKWRGKNGRIDIRIDELDGIIAVIEIKSTNWDEISDHRIRATALRHARQLWRYVEREVESGANTSSGLIYQHSPASAAKKRIVEEALDERGIQVVWRDVD